MQIKKGKANLFLEGTLRPDSIPVRPRPPGRLVLPVLHGPPTATEPGVAGQADVDSSCWRGFNLTYTARLRATLHTMQTLVLYRQPYCVPRRHRARPRAAARRRARCPHRLEGLRHCLGRLQRNVRPLPCAAVTPAVLCQLGPEAIRWCGAGAARRKRHGHAATLCLAAAVTHLGCAGPCSHAESFRCCLQPHLMSAPLPDDTAGAGGRGTGRQQSAASCTPASQCMHSHV